MRVCMCGINCDFSVRLSHIHGTLHVYAAYQIHDSQNIDFLQIPCAHKNTHPASLKNGLTLDCANECGSELCVYTNTPNCGHHRTINSPRTHLRALYAHCYTSEHNSRRFCLGGCVCVYATGTHRLPTHRWRCACVMIPSVCAEWAN